MSQGIEARLWRDPQEEYLLPFGDVHRFGKWVAEDGTGRILTLAFIKGGNEEGDRLLNPYSDVRSALLGEVVPPEGPDPDIPPYSGDADAWTWLPGTYHTVTADLPRFENDETKLRQGVSYDRARISFDLACKGTTDATAWNNLFWFVINGRNRDMLGYGLYRGQGSGEVLERHGIGTDHGDKTKERGNVRLSGGKTYHVAYSYDATEGGAVLRVYKGSGQADGNGNHKAPILEIVDTEQMLNFEGKFLTVHQGFPFDPDKNSEVPWPNGTGFRNGTFEAWEKK